MQTSVVNLLIALAGVIATMALGLVSQRRLARTDYVQEMEKSLREQLADARAQNLELKSKVVALEGTIVSLRADNVELMRRLVRVENGNSK